MKLGAKIDGTFLTVVVLLGVGKVIVCCGAAFTLVVAVLSDRLPLVALVCASAGVLSNAMSIGRCKHRMTALWIVGTRPMLCP